MKAIIEHHKKQKKTGIILGAFTPILFSPLVCYLLYLYRPPKNEEGLTYHFWDLYLTLLNHKVQLPIFISLCATSNLLIFFILLRKKREWMARGMIYSTLVYAILYFILKLS